MVYDFNTVIRYGKHMGKMLKDIPPHYFINVYYQKPNECSDIDLWIFTHENIDKIKGKSHYLATKSGVCSKLKYHSKIDAKKKVKLKGSNIKSVYLCPICGYWHTSTQIKKEE